MSFFESWYDSTWDWTQVSQTIGEHSTRGYVRSKIQSLIEGDHRSDIKQLSWPGKYDTKFLLQRILKREESWWSRKRGPLKRSCKKPSQWMDKIEFCWTYEDFMDYLDVNGAYSNIISSAIYLLFPIRCNKSQAVGVNRLWYLRIVPQRVRDLASCTLY